jgi:hypothetical protein
MSVRRGERSLAADTEQEQAEQVAYDPPPVGEEIHLPGGSVLPLLTAIGVTLTLIGTTIWLGWSILGLLILVTSVGLWIRDVRHDIDALPDEHGHGAH